MFISVIVTGVAFSIHRLNTSYYLREDAYLQQYQNLRVALYTIGRDVRMAGNGMFLIGPRLKKIQAYVPSREILKSGLSEIQLGLDWYRHADAPASSTGVRAIYGVDGGSDRPDTLTVFRSEVEYGAPIGQAKGFKGSDLQMSEPVPAGTVKPGDIVVLAKGSQAVLLEAGAFSGNLSDSIPINPKGRYTAPSFTDNFFNPSQAYVYNFRDAILVTYYLAQDTADPKNFNLMADYHDITKTSYDNPAAQSSIVAANIEDFQVYYYFDSDPVDLAKVTDTPSIGSSLLDSNKVKAVAIGLTSRSAWGDGPRLHKRPSLFNRDAGSALDNRKRNTLIETISLRNYKS
jgi:hypothetical protein